MEKLLLTQISLPEFRKLLREEVRKVITEERLIEHAEEKEIINVEEAAELMGLAKQTMYVKCSNKEIPYYKRYGRIYFKRSALTDFIDKKLEKVDLTNGFAIK
jgi:excisionase family DNA binding protein